MTATLLTGPDQKGGCLWHTSRAWRRARDSRRRCRNPTGTASMCGSWRAGRVGRPSTCKLKATADLAETQDGFRRFRLGIKNYDDLRVETQTPRLLVVLDLPKDKAQWMTVTTEELVLRRRAYWVSLQIGHEEVVRQETVTVRIPEGNVFDVATLQTLISLWRK